MNKLLSWKELKINTQEAIEAMEKLSDTNLTGTYQLDTEIKFVFQTRGDELQGFLAAKYLDNTWNIYNIVVKEQYQRQQVGSKLIQQLESEAIILEVDDTNPAVSFYNKLGFTVMREIRNYYSSGNTALVMYRPCSTKV